MPLDVFRSKELSNQIDRLFQTAYFTADGFTTDFTLSFEVYYNDYQHPSESAEIKVFENGQLSNRQSGLGIEYTVEQDINGKYKVVRFLTAPVSGHLIDVVYRVMDNKV